MCVSVFTGVKTHTGYKVLLQHKLSNLYLHHVQVLLQHKMTNLYLHHVQEEYTYNEFHNISFLWNGFSYEHGWLAIVTNSLSSLPLRRRCERESERVSNISGAAQSARFSPCLSLYPFSPPPHLNNRPLSALPSSTRHYTSPSPPSILLPVLWTPRHLSALMPPSSASLPPP